MASMDERSRMEYAALMSQARDADRLMFAGWMVAGIASAMMLAWGIGSGQPGLMVPVVLLAAAGFLAVARWREQATWIAGYIEAYHESEGEASYHTRLGRLRATVGNAGARDWHVTTFFNAIAVCAAVFAWVSSSHADHGELWAGVVTGCALAFGSYSISETARHQNADPAAQWRRADGGPKEVQRRAAY